MIDLATWITDRTATDVERVNTLATKAKAGTWTEAEQKEWAAGMKGALSYQDYNRIESGISEIAAIVNAKVSVKTNWDENGYLTTADATRWISNINAVREKCSGYGSTPSSPSALKLYFLALNEIEKILQDIENLANDHLIYCSEPICGGEPYYGIC